jgi:hypothetical protein
MEKPDTMSSARMENSIGKYLERALGNKCFEFKFLAFSGIDNGPVFARNHPSIREQEISLFHNSFRNGDEYVDALSSRIKSAIEDHRALPVVRFADGEYAFYRLSLKCNGLYNQAESIKTIRQSIPLHLSALRFMQSEGIMAPLIFPGNVHRRNFFAIKKEKHKNDSALRFLGFLQRNHMRLGEKNYFPFYSVYACLSSTDFSKKLDGKRICIVNSDFDAASCETWFSRVGSRPIISFAKIPDSYMATRWPQTKESVLAQIREAPDLFLVGAGAGALLACVDLASHFSVPAIDAGHVLNMMNGLERKSAGPRLFTYSR